MAETGFDRIAVMGAGAVGSFYGAMLARAGRSVTLIGREAHVQAIRRDGLQLQMAGRTEAVRLDASSDVATVAAADLVLCCVKSTDTRAVALQMAPHLRRDAVVMSLQNGVDNADTLAHHLRCAVVPAAVYVATAMGGPGQVQHFGRGDLVIGALRPPADAATQSLLQALVALFAAAAVPVRIVDDVALELWGKLLVNCAYNAISGIAQQSYGAMAARDDVRRLQASVVREVVAVAAAAGVQLPLQASLEAMTRIAAAMPAQLSSTAQDMARRKPSEIDHLNGYIARRGHELGVPTPVNETLTTLVKLIESSVVVA